MTPDQRRRRRETGKRSTRVEQEWLDVREVGCTGVTRLVAAVDAVQGGVAVSGRLLCTRLWVHGPDGRRVLAAALVPADDR